MLRARFTGPLAGSPRLSYRPAARARVSIEVSPQGLKRHRIARARSPVAVDSPGSAEIDATAPIPAARPPADSARDESVRNLASVWRAAANRLRIRTVPIPAVDSDIGVSGAPVRAAPFRRPRRPPHADRGT
jgi:hypothetical protein